MNADWMQARIAELERVNAALVAERDDARDWSEAWKRAAVMYRGAYIYRTTSKTGPHAPAVTYDDPDEDEMIARLETTLRGWQPGLTARVECRGNAGAGYAAQEREDDHA